MRRLRRRCCWRGAACCCTAACSNIQPWVKPYERDRLADPIMAWDRDAISAGLPGSHPRSPAKDRAAPPAARAAAAAAIDGRDARAAHRRARIAVLAALLLVRATCADVLPDDRADLFYSKYSGGGMDITGESVLVRKKFTENFALEGELFRRQGERRVHRRAEPGEPDQGRAQAKERHRRIRARQDHVHAVVSSTASSATTSPTPRASR